jgi:nitrile hydratase
MPHDHSDHDHRAHALLPPDPALRVRALETLLARKGYVDPAAMDAIIDFYQNKVGPRIGARVVARAWSDSGYLAALRTDATATLEADRLLGRQGEHIVVVENTPEMHNVVVCTLCSCYPWPLLGIPPAWYKSDAYRARVVREPRKVLAEFGLSLPEEQAVRVWDSTAEIRYLVLPMRPEETRDLGIDELTAWVTRNSMIGTGLPERPK